MYACVPLWLLERLQTLASKPICERMECLDKLLGSLYSLILQVLNNYLDTQAPCEFELQQALGQTVDELRVHMSTYNKEGQVLHNPNIFMSVSQYKWYCGLQNTAKKIVDAVLQNLNPLNTPQLLNAMVDIGIPAQLDDEEAALYFAMWEGLKKMEDLLYVTDVTCLFYMRKALYAFSQTLPYPQLTEAISKDLNLHADIALYKVINTRTSTCFKHILNQEAPGDMKPSETDLEELKLVISDMDIQQMGVIFKASNIKKLREGIVKLPDDPFRSVKTTYLIRIDNNKKKLLSDKEAFKEEKLDFRDALLNIVRDIAAQRLFTQKQIVRRREAN